MIANEISELNLTNLLCEIMHSVANIYGICVCVTSRYERYDEYFIFDCLNTPTSFRGAICLIKSHVSEATKIALALVKLSPRERERCLFC